MAYIGNNGAIGKEKGLYRANVKGYCIAHDSWHPLEIGL